jgi:hypothetical protein
MEKPKRQAVYRVSDLPDYYEIYEKIVKQKLGTMTDPDTKGKVTVFIGNVSFQFARSGNTKVIVSYVDKNECDAVIKELEIRGIGKEWTFERDIITARDYRLALEEITEVFSKAVERIEKIAKKLGKVQEERLSKLLDYSQIIHDYCPWLPADWEIEMPNFWDYYKVDQEKLVSPQIPLMILLKCEKPLEDEDLDCRRLDLKDEFKLKDELIYRNEAIIKILQRYTNKIFDTLCARLYDYHYEKESNKLTLTFQPVRYFNSICTNHFCDIRYKEWEKTTREIVAPGPSLPNLNISDCANILGLNLILELTDDLIFLHNRSHLVVSHPGKLGPSVGAEMEWNDCTPFDALKREAHLELGITRDMLKETKLVALGRDLQKAGRPEAFFTGKLDLSSRDLLDIWRQKERRGQEYWELYEEVPFLFLKIDRLNVGKIIERVDVPITTKAALWFWLESKLT